MSGLLRRRTYSLGWRIVLSGVLSFNGCAWLPEPSQRAEMISLPKLDKASAESGLPVAMNWPAQDWWTLFETPILAHLIETAVTENPDLKTVAARLQQAQAVVDFQAAELYPTVTANASFSAQRFSANSTQAKLAGEHFRLALINPLVLRYHLDLWGRDKAVLEAAIGNAMAGEAELADARLLLSAAVARAYFELAAVAEKLALAEELASCRERLLKLVQVRRDLGLVAIAPLLQAEVELHQARQRVTALRAEIELNKNLLATLAGKGPDWGRAIEAQPGMSAIRPALPQDLPLHLLAHRPDVRAAHLRVEAAAQEIKVARTAFYPDVNLVSFAGLHSVSISDVLLQGSSLAYAVGPSVEFPIFEGGRLRAQLGYREAAYDEAVERYNGQLLNAVQEVADALARWRDIDARLAEQRQSVARISESLQQAEVLYRQGLSDRGDLIEGQAAEFEQRLQLAALQGEYFKAAVQVFKALGGGYSVNEKE